MAWYDPRDSDFLGIGRKTPKEYKQIDPHGQISGEADRASGLADAATANQFGARSRQSELADMLERQARGEDLYSPELLRQGLEQQVAGMQSMAASAAPRNQAMAARNAMLQGGRAMSGLSGQQALASIREQQAAQQALGGVLGGMRGQDLQAALGSRGQALQGYGALEDARTRRYGALAGQPTGMQSLLSAGGGLAALLASDRRLKRDIKPGDEKVRQLADGLEAYAYRYKDAKHGTGEQLGILAQDLERAGLESAVMDTPEGKMVDAAKLSGALAALAGNLHRRVGALEKS